MKTDAGTMLKLAGLPPFVREHPFAAPSRRWRFDFAWPEHKVALEVEGGVWTRGRHTRGAGYEADIVKYNAGILMGWLIIRATTGQVQKGLAVAWVTQALRLRDDGTEIVLEDAGVASPRQKAEE